MEVVVIYRFLIKKVMNDIVRRKINLKKGKILKMYWWVNKLVKNKGKFE